MRLYVNCKELSNFEETKIELLVPGEKAKDNIKCSFFPNFLCAVFKQLTVNTNCNYSD